MKKIIALALTVFMVFSATACGSEATKTTTVPTDVSTDPIETTVALVEPTAPAGTVPETLPATNEPESAGSLGDFGVEIHDYVITEDRNGTPVILIAYTFTNNSDESESAAHNLYFEAYQNGIGLDGAYFVEYDGYDVEAEMRDVKNGVSVDLMAAFTLSDPTAPVQFEVTELISFSNDVIGKTFYISDETSIELEQAPVGDFVAEVGDYIVSIVSYSITENHKGEPVLYVELGFSNNGNESRQFASAISFEAFQDGIELDTAYLMDDDSGESQMRDVKPGAGTLVTKAFVLTSNTSVVEIEIKESISFSDEVITTELVIAE